MATGNIRVTPEQLRPTSLAETMEPDRRAA
jgi:hypothetical protein